VLRWLKTVVVSDRGEGALDASGGDQEDVPESVWPGCPGAGVRCWGVVSKIEVASKAGGLAVLPWRAWRVPDDWPGGARREGGVSLVCGSGTEREKASVESVDPGS